MTTWDGINRRKITNADQAHILFILENAKITRIQNELDDVRKRIEEIKQYLQGKNDGTN